MPLSRALLVYEKRPRWESELKRELAGLGLRVRPCRSATDVLELAARMPCSVIVIDFDCGPADSLQLLGHLVSRRIEACAVLISKPELTGLEWPARELGAAALLPETVSAAELAALCLRLAEVPPIT